MVSKNNILISTSQIIAAYVSRASVAPEQLTVLVEEIYKKLLQLSDDTTNSILTVNCNVPCVDPKDSITDEYLICLEDGKKFKSLRRHLMSHYNMTPEQYRSKWNLHPDYPMVAPSYSSVRSKLAKENKLGKK